MIVVESTLALKNHEVKLAEGVTVLRMYLTGAKYADTHDGYSSRYAQ